MAKTLEQIQLFINTAKKNQQELVQEMLDKQASYSQLADLNNTSSAGFIVQIRNLVAFVAAQIYDLLLTQISEIFTLVSENRYGSVSWYEQKVLEFQYGDSLLVVFGETQYATVDESKRIVKKVSVAQSDIGEITFYVWGENERLLTTAELASLKDYINRIKIIGTKVAVVSQDAVVIYMEVDVVKNSLLIDNSGKRIGTNVYPIPIIINDYLMAIQPKQVFVNSWFEADIVANQEIVSLNVLRLYANNDGVNYALEEAPDFIENSTGKYVLDPNSVFRYV